MFFLSAGSICSIVIIAFIYPYYGINIHLCLRHYWSFFCIMFMVWWWILYFISPKLKVYSLWLFLLDKSRLRSEPRANEINEIIRLENAIDVKCTSSILVLTIYIAILAIFITAVMGKDLICDYQRLLRTVILIVAVITVISMILAIDLLDSVANLFRRGAKKPYEYKLIFYKECGPSLPKGGIGYAYLGYAFFSLFLILSVSFFDPLLAGLGMSVYTYLGYPIMFGYKGVKDKDNNISVEFDDNNKVNKCVKENDNNISIVEIISIILGGFFLLMTILIYILGYFGL
jgi:hypothetical protein